MVPSLRPNHYPYEHYLLVTSVSTGFCITRKLEMFLHLTKNKEPSSYSPSSTAAGTSTQMCNLMAACNRASHCSRVSSTAFCFLLSRTIYQKCILNPFQGHISPASLTSWWRQRLLWHHSNFRKTFSSLKPILGHQDKNPKAMCQTGRQPPWTYPRRLTLWGNNSCNKRNHS